MPAHHTLQVRFLRRVQGGGAESDGSRDDIIHISKLGENSLRLSYTERSDDGAVVDVMNFTYQQALTYMHRALWLVSLDEDPFQSVQCFIPGFPTFLVQVTTLKENMTSILELFYSVFMAWPAVGVERADGVRTARHFLMLERPGVSSSLPSLSSSPSLPSLPSSTSLPSSSSLPPLPSSPSPPQQNQETQENQQNQRIAQT